MNRYLALLKRELKSITKEKTIMFAIIVQFFIASFSSIILVGIMAFYDPSSIGENTNVRIRAGVVIHQSAGYSGEDEDMEKLVKYLDDGNIRMSMYPDMAWAEKDFERNRVDTIIAMTKNANGVVDMQLVMPELDTRKTVVFMVLDKPLKQFENYLREASGVELLYTDTGGEPNTTYEFLYSLIVPILMLFPALIAGSIVIDTISEEFENKTFDTLAAAPVSLFQVVGAKVSAAVVTAGIQVVMWVGLLRLNDIVIENAGLVILLGIVIASAISVLTAVMSLCFKDRERTQFVYSIVLVLFIAGSYFLDPSPFGLITRLAAGDPGLGIGQVALYAIPLGVIGFLLLNLSRRLVMVRR